MGRIKKEMNKEVRDRDRDTHTQAERQTETDTDRERGRQTAQGGTTCRRRRVTDPACLPPRLRISHNRHETPP